jgi:hypothetical protein
VRVPIGYYDPARTIPVLASGAVTLTSLAADGETPPGLVVERTTRWSADGVAGSRATSLIGNFRD